jgi:hypothetical protein
MLNIAYGLKAKSDTDRLIELAEQGAEPINAIFVPGAFLVVCTVILYLALFRSRNAYRTNSQLLSTSQIGSQEQASSSRRRNGP